MFHVGEKVTCEWLVGIVVDTESDLHTPIKVQWNDGDLGMFTSDGRVWKGQDVCLFSLEDAKASPLPDIWVQFMCAALARESSVNLAAVRADAALEKYKARFQ